MKNNRFPTLALAAWMTLGAVASASALPIFSAAPATPQRIQLAQGDCYAVGQQVAAENGGTLAKATPEDQDGQQVCVIVVLLPAQDGQRPRRVEFVRKM
jgi:hypothetical protein